MIEFQLYSNVLTLHIPSQEIFVDILALHLLCIAFGLDFVCTLCYTIFSLSYAISATEDSHFCVVSFTPTDLAPSNGAQGLSSCSLLILPRKELPTQTLVTSLP